MSDRRKFFLLAAGAVLALGAVPPTQAPVHRYDRAADRWVPIHRRSIRAGDEVWVEGDGVYLADTDAEQKLDGRWTFWTHYRIDPATNAWVPA